MDALAEPLKIDSSCIAMQFINAAAFPVILVALDLCTNTIICSRARNLNDAAALLKHHNEHYFPFLS